MLCERGHFECSVRLALRLYVFTRALFCVPVTRALVQLSSLMISLRLRLRLRLRLSPAVGICTRRIGRNFNPDAGDALGQRQPYSYRKHAGHRSFLPSSGSGQPHALAVVSHSSAQTAASVPAAAGTARRGP